MTEIATITIGNITHVNYVTLSFTLENNKINLVESEKHCIFAISKLLFGLLGIAFRIDIMYND